MKKFIEWDSIEVKGNQSGKKKTTCPNCSHTRKKKKDPCLYVDFTSGVAKCFNCEALSFRDSVEKQTKKEYKVPRQDWKNYTVLSDNLVKYIEGRKISQSTAMALGWTEEEYYQPSLNKKVNNLVFNFFEGDALVNKKYRTGSKNFTQSAGTKSIFYNINSIVGQTEAIIVEGEMDVAAFYEIGIKNVISVPNGANDNDDFWRVSKKYLDNIEKFIIATDNDEKGISLRNKIAQRLGRYKCTFIEFDGKDANDDLIKGCLQETYNQAQRFPVSGTFNAEELYDGMLNLYDNGLPKTIYPNNDCFGDMKDIFSIMRGQLTVGTGVPSHGKSNFTDYYVLNLLAENDFKGSWFSPEHTPMELYHTNLAEKVIGKNYWKDKGGVKRMSKEELKQYKDWANEKIYLTACEDTDLPTWDWLLDKFKEQMYSFGIDIFVIDAFNKVLLPKGNKIEQINIVLTKLTHFAQVNNVMIFLVAHPTKMQKDESGVYGVPTLYDVAGSADFRNQTHNGYTIYRTFGNNDTNEQDKTTFYNMKTKFNFQGEIGKSLDFNYCLANGRYYVDDVDPPMYNLITREIPETIETDDFEKDVPLPTVNPASAFGDIIEEVSQDEVPF
jgi:twinkle protein